MIFYSNFKHGYRPFAPSFITNWREVSARYISKPKRFIATLLFISPLYSCGIIPWHSVEQVPSEPVAYIRDGVFVSGEYIRSASISEIDNQIVTKSNNNLIEIAVGQRQVKIYCDEAKGEFNSLEFSGESKTLEFEAQMQRTYQVRCEPYTHWWIEDIVNKKVVAGEKFN